MQRSTYQLNQGRQCLCLSASKLSQICIQSYPGNTCQEYFNHICGSLLNFKKSYSSHLNILRSIVPQMFMTISIKKFNQLSVNFLK